MPQVLTPDGKPIRDNGICSCAVHCPNSPYHEKACCHEAWCHQDEYSRIIEPEDGPTDKNAEEPFFDVGIMGS